MDAIWKHWSFDYQEALERAGKEHKPVFLQFHREQCSGCKKTYALVYSNHWVSEELHRWFIPLRLDILGDRKLRRNYAGVWTPSFYVLDYHGQDFDHIEGYLPPEDFRVQLRLFLAAYLLPGGKYSEIAALAEDAMHLFPDNDRMPALLFKKGQAIYLSSWDNKQFRAVMQEIRDTFPDSPQARMWPWLDE